jgi:hypothetical protein
MRHFGDIGDFGFAANIQTEGIVILDLASRISEIP